MPGGKDIRVLLYIVYISAIKRRASGFIDGRFTSRVHFRVVNNFPKCPLDCSHTLVTPDSRRERRRKTEKKKTGYLFLLKMRSTFKSATPTHPIHSKTIRLYLDLPPSRTFSKVATFSSRVGRRNSAIRRGNRIAKSPWK